MIRAEGNPSRALLELGIVLTCELATGARAHATLTNNATVGEMMPAIPMTDTRQCNVDRVSLFSTRNEPRIHQADAGDDI